MARKNKNYPIKRPNNKNQNLIKDIDKTIEETHENQVILTRENGQYYVTSINELQRESYYSGPLPSPEVLEKYDKLYPGTAKNFIDDYRKVLDKEIDRSDKVVNAEVSSKRIGSWTSAIFVIGSLGATIIFGVLGLPIPATVSSLTTLGGLYFAYLKKDD